MALLPIYTSVGAAAGGPEWGNTAIEGTNAQVYYVPAVDAFFQEWYAAHRIYRDGSAVRLGVATGFYYYYDRNVNLPVWRKSATERIRIDPVTFQPSPSNPAPWTTSFTPALEFSESPAILKGVNFYYLTGNQVVQVKNATTGASVTSYNFNIPFTFILIDGIWFTEDGKWMYVTDADNEDLAGVGNGRGILRAWNLLTNTMAFEWKFDRSYKVAYDHIRDQLWTIRVADKKVKIYNLTPAPASFTPFTVGTNRARYKEDAITATLVGTEGEPVPNWPVGWTLADGQGHLAHDYTVTDENGETTNHYCGPGVDDFTGADQTITVWTAY